MAMRIIKAARDVGEMAVPTSGRVARSIPRWDVGRGGTRRHAARRDRTGYVLTRASADGLAMALRVSCGSFGASKTSLNRVRVPSLDLVT